MKRFANMKIKAKMLISFMLVIALMAALSVFAALQMGAIGETYTVAIEHPLSLKASLLEYQSNFRDVRRLVSLISTYTGSDPEMCESLYKDTGAAFDRAMACMDEMERIISTNPLLTQPEKDSRISGVIALRSMNAQYRADFVESMMAAAREGNHEKSLEILNSNDSVAEMRDKTIAMLDTAEKTAENTILAAADGERRTTVLMAVIAVLASAFAVFAALYVSGSVAGPLASMAGAFTAIGEQGDLDLPAETGQYAEKCAARKDEVGAISKAALNLIRRLHVISGVLGQVAEGDLTSDLPLLSGRDSIGQAANKMIEDLNNIFSEINNSTLQVSTGARQVADGSQALAQGSTEQAASVQELSASIHEIADKTKANAEMASKAAILANTIMGSAEKGSRQMDEMMAAVKDINQASQQIGKVIKVIDDIAFQTNILALNAAVEAARAGQHGKGFAVVAEEVRNLASKSAEAAKETGNLIANSSEKAELGSRIAEETSSSLTEIVQGINESSKLIMQIAQSSDEQSAGITQVNKGIDQVAQVVQQNSATAEQSAAASEEMSGQSSMLEELIAQFKLKQRDAAPNVRLGRGRENQKQLVMPERAAHAAMPRSERRPAYALNAAEGFGKY